MTDEQIDAMQAGPEMDIAVCDACFAPDFYRLTWLMSSRPPCPSSDWNAAMMSAEQFGLFKGNDDGMLRGMERRVFGSDDWYVYSRLWDEFTVIASGAGPIAICRAILKLSKEQSNATNHL